MTENEKIRRAVLEAARDGRVSCTAARKLARELRVSPREIGRACNEMKIKIHACELGCF